MKDQRLLLRKCQLNEIPAVIFQGQDYCALDIMGAAKDIYKNYGCGMEFLYDFDSLIRNFEGYQVKHRSTLGRPKLVKMESLKSLVNDCIYTDKPVIVLQGSDACAVDILRSANDIYKQKGCSKTFQKGFESLINDFEEYRELYFDNMKLPELSDTEKEFIREDMDYDFDNAVKNGNLVHLTTMKELGYPFDEKKIENYISLYPDLLQFIDHPSEGLIIAAVRVDPNAILHVDELSEKAQMIAVNASSYAIQGIRNPADKVLLTAIHKCPEVFEFVDNPSDTVKMAAVKLKPDNLQYIEEPYKEIIEVAMHLEPDVYKHCDNITEAMYKSVIEPYRTFKSAIEKNEFTKLVELSECGYRPSSELIRLLSGTFSESTSVALQKIFGMEVFASSNIQLRIDLPDSDVMSRQQSNVIEQSV